MANLLIEPGARVLFQGDSITDAGRSKEDDSTLGSGYANMTAAWLSAKYPDHKLTFFNRGISGNEVFDLEARWAKDCIDIQPDWLSILIGINDVGHELRGESDRAPADFEACYRRILERVKNETRARVIILEPFLLPGREDQQAWRGGLLPRIEAARTVARDFGHRYIPLDGLFGAASTRREPEFWSVDRVHPTQPGHALIAQAWIEAVEQ